MWDGKPSEKKRNKPLRARANMVNEIIRNYHPVIGHKVDLLVVFTSTYLIGLLSISQYFPPHGT